MVQAEKIVADFKKFDNPQIITSQGLTYNRYSYSAEIDLFIDYFKKNDIGSELLAIKLIDKNLKHLVDAKNKLDDFANKLCDKITYLSESFKLIEIDQYNHRAQIRSYPPFVSKDKKLFFEIEINASKNSLLLSRKAADIIQHKVKPVSFVLNDEILERIIRDLIEHD